MNKFIMKVPKLPDEMDFDDRLDWYMLRFGKSVGLEIACASFALIEQHQEKRQPGDDIVFSFEIVTKP